MKTRYIILFFLSATLATASCRTGSHKSPPVSFDKYKIAEGFEIQLAAAEPLIEAPVALDFDNQGRMWTVEMRGFMPDLAGNGDNAPIGRISILEDQDKDGVADHSKPFLDSLVLPRALAHVYGGLLYTEPPNLWFVDITNDKPGKRTLVDSLYSAGGSPEAQANGLMMNIDNWIYSAFSNFRYQLKDGRWRKEPTAFRGQFGITKDDFGRLYYNSNEIQIAGDYALPNTFIANPFLKPKAAINKLLTDDQRVYPLHPTTVNRGYAKGILTKDSLLRNVTAACGPLVYRGDQFPADYYQNVFVCEPQANLVKRNILAFEGVKTTATQAWDNKEFLASTDEGFRPVNAFNGPDGAMYVVDMHRGVMEYRAFTTPYYNTGITGKKLDTLLRAGRILRIKHKAKALGRIPNLPDTPADELVNLLKSHNGWIRDRAQQLLVLRKDPSVVPALQQLAQDRKDIITAVHALHALEGLNALSYDFLHKIAFYGDPMQSAHALLLLQGYSTIDHAKSMGALANQLLDKNDAFTDLYLAAYLAPWINLSKETFLPILASIAEAHPGNAIYQEAVVSSLKGLEETFQAFVKNTRDGKHTNKVLDTLLTQTIRNKQERDMNSIYVQQVPPVDARTNGWALFRSTCATCHGPDGDGMEHIAPPLKGSAYVEGSTERLAMIILNGLEGPIHLKGQLYNFNGTMPNFGNNFTDKEIADIIQYLHNAYVSKPTTTLTPEQIKELRKKRSGTLTEKDLLEMNDSLNMNLSQK